LDNIIAVAASNDNDELADFSNYGEKTIDLAAPGVHILSSIPTGSSGSFEGYAFISGSSMSTAYTAGVAGLVMTAEPYEDALEIKERILNNVDKMQSLINRTSAGGRLNAYASQPSSQMSSSLKISNLLNAPNPFSQSTYFTYELSKRAQIEIRIYNIAGERVRMIEDASGEAGFNKTFWDGRRDTETPLPNGVYIYQIVAKTEDEISKKTGKAAILK
ncbi:MAG: S8 family serine peptidase, partial [Candidatus Aerophobetes bacterium]|nr:S8 family serine peptidase [Candidatus Aerophobetes bacterium]